MAIKEEQVELVVCDICGRNHTQVKQFLGLNPNEGCHGDGKHAMRFGPTENLSGPSNFLRSYKKHVCGFCIQSFSDLGRGE